MRIHCECNPIISYEPRRTAAARALGQIKFEDQNQLRQGLVQLNRQLHDLDDGVRGAALVAISNLVEGRPLPGYRWIPLRRRIERRRWLYFILHWLMLLIGVMLVALALAYLDEKSLLIRILTGLGGLIGIGAGIAQIVGKTLRNPWEREEA